MSTLSGLANKTDKNKAKYKALDINNVYKGTSVAPQKSTAAARHHGLQSLGKLPSRRMPPPAILPSLRSEQGGADQTVSLVPSGSSGWGAKEDEKVGTPAAGTQPPTAQLPNTGRITQPSAQPKVPVESSVSSGSGVVSAGQSWSSVTSGARNQGRLNIQKSRFQEEFPELASGADDKQQVGHRKEEDSRELQYGPGPSLRPQNVASWREGGGRSLPVQPADEERSTPTPPSASVAPAASSEDDEPSAPAFHPQPQMAAMPPRMMRPGMGPGPRMGPGGPMLYGPVMPPFMFPGHPFPPQFAGFPPGHPYFHPDQRFRGPLPPQMGFDGPPEKPTKPFTERSAIIKDHELKEFDKLNPGDGSWAAAADAELDYNTRIVFSDDEEGSSGRNDKKVTSPRDRRPQRSGSSRGLDRDWSADDTGPDGVSGDRITSEVAADSDKSRVRDRKRPPQVDRENSFGAKEPSSPQPMSQYGRPPVDVHWQARMQFGHPRMPVMYHLPPGGMPRPATSPYGRPDEKADIGRVGHRPTRDDTADGERYYARNYSEDDESKGRFNDRRSEPSDEDNIDSGRRRTISESSDGKGGQKQMSLSSSGRGLIKLTSQNSRKSVPEEESLEGTPSSTSLDAADTIKPPMAGPPVRGMGPSMWGAPWTRMPGPPPPFMVGSGWQKNMPAGMVPPQFYGRPQHFDEGQDKQDRHVPGDEMAEERVKRDSAVDSEKKPTSTDDRDTNETSRKDAGEKLASDSRSSPRSSSTHEEKDKLHRSNEKGRRRESNRSKEARKSADSWADVDNDAVDNEKKNDADAEWNQDGSRSHCKSTGRGLQQGKQERRRTEPRHSCPPPISLRQSQQNMSTSSRYTPLKRSTANNTPSDTTSQTTSAGQSVASAHVSELKTPDSTNDLLKPKKTLSRESLSEVQSQLSDSSSLTRLSDVSHLEKHQSWGEAVEDAVKRQEEEEQNRVKAAETKPADSGPQNREDTGPGSGDVRRRGTNLGVKSTGDGTPTEDRPPTKKMRDETNFYRNRRDDGYSRSERSDRTRNVRSRGKNENYRGSSNSGSGRGKAGTGSRYTQGRDGATDYPSVRGEKRGTLTFERSDLQREKLDGSRSFDSRRGPSKMSESVSQGGFGRGDRDQVQDSRRRDGQTSGSSARKNEPSNVSKQSDSSSDAVKPPPLMTIDAEPPKTCAWDQPLIAPKPKWEQPAKQWSSGVLQDSSNIHWTSSTAQEKGNDLDGELTKKDASDLPKQESMHSGYSTFRSDSRQNSIQGDRHTREPLGSGGVDENMQREYRSGRGRRRPARRGNRQNWQDSAAGREPGSQTSQRRPLRSDRSYTGQPGEQDYDANQTEWSRSDRRRTKFGSDSRGVRSLGRGDTSMTSSRSRGRGNRVQPSTEEPYLSRAGENSGYGGRQMGGEMEPKRDHRRRNNWRRSGQSYGRGSGSRAATDDNVPYSRRGQRVSSSSQQSPKALSQSVDQNSDVGNEEWETASESSDVLSHHHRHDTKSTELSSGAQRDNTSGRRDNKKSSVSHQPLADRNRRENTSEPRTAGVSGSVSGGRNGSLGQLQSARSNSSGNGRGPRGTNGTGSSRSDQVSSRGATATSDTSSKLRSKSSDAKEDVAKKEKEKKDAMANIDINNYASVVVIDDQPEVSIDDPSFLFESNEGFQEVTSRRAQKSKQRAAIEEALKKTQEQQAQAAAVAKKAEKEAKKQRVPGGKLPPRLAGRRDKKPSRSHAHHSSADDATLPAVSSEVLTKIENWDNEILPKIENWDNEMANNIPTEPVIALEPLPPRNAAAAVPAIVTVPPAASVGKWETPVSSVLTDTVSAVPVSLPVSEKVDLQEPSVDSAEPLAAAMNIISSSADIDTKLRLPASIEPVSSDVTSALPLDAVAQPVQSQSAAVEIRLSEIGPFLSDVQQLQQQSAHSVEQASIKPMPKLDENRAVKKPDSTASRPPRSVAYEPIELPGSSFAFNKFSKGENSSELKLDFTFDASLAQITNEKVEQKDSHAEPPPPISMPPGAILHRSTAVVAASVAELLPLQSPAADELNMKIMSVKNVWEREHQTSLAQIFEQSIMAANQRPNIPMSEEMIAVQPAQQQQQQQLQQPSVPSYTNYSSFVNTVSMVQMSASAASELAQPQEDVTSCIDDLAVSASTTGGMMGNVSALDDSDGLVYIDPENSYATTMKETRNFLNEQTNVCKVRPQLQASTSPPAVAHLRAGGGGVPSVSANATQLMFAATAAHNYQYTIGASQLLAQDNSGIGLQYGGQAAFSYNISQAAAGLLAPVAQSNLFLQAAMPAALQQTDLYSANASQLQAYRNPFAPPAQPNTIMVSSTTSSLMSAAIKPPSQHLYLASGSQKTSQLPAAVQYGQLIGNTALQQAQSQLCVQYEPTAQPALATSPVQSDPILAAQSSQIIGSQLAQQRAMQALQPQANYYSQTPLQQTGFYQAQQAASGLQGSFQHLTAQQFPLSAFGLQAPTMTVPVQPVHSQLKHSAPPFKPASQQQVKTLTSSAPNSFTSSPSIVQQSYLQQQSAVAHYNNLLQQLPGGATGVGSSPYQFYTQQQQQQTAVSQHQSSPPDQYYSGSCQATQQSLQDHFQLHQQGPSQGQGQGQFGRVSSSSVPPTGAMTGVASGSGSSGSAASWQGTAVSRGSILPTASASSGPSQYPRPSSFSGQPQTAESSKSAGSNVNKAGAAHMGQKSSSAHAYGPSSGSQVSAAGASGQSLKELQAQERRKALQHVQSFLNPQNKPPAKSVTVSGKLDNVASGSAKAEPRSNADTK